MEEFKSIIVNLWGQRGRAWLDELPRIIECAVSRWGLRGLEPLPTMNYNYVLSGFQSNKPIILKLGLDSQALELEALALQCFAGHGAVKVIEKGGGMLLLERAVPGNSLRSYFPDRENEAVAIFCDVVKRLSSAQISEKQTFPHMRDWLSALEYDWDMPTYYLQKARTLSHAWLATAGSDLLLHADLHHDNILRNGQDWVAIDPKGVMGDVAYEAAAFICNPIPDLLQQGDAVSIIENRIYACAHSLGVSPEKMTDISFIKAVLAWIWALEDKTDSGYWQRMVVILSGLIVARGQGRAISLREV